MKILSLRQVLFLHQALINKHGGAKGIRDINLLKSAIYTPFVTFNGKDLYKGPYIKAATLLRSLVENYPFIDGNKRTAFVCTYIFLKSEGIKLTVEKKEAVKFMISVTKKKLSVEEIASWIKKFSDQKISGPF